MARRFILPAGFGRLADAKGIAAAQNATVDTSDLVPPGCAYVVDEDLADGYRHTRVLRLGDAQSLPP